MLRKIKFDSFVLILLPFSYWLERLKIFELFFIAIFIDLFISVLKKFLRKGFQYPPKVFFLIGVSFLVIFSYSLRIITNYDPEYFYIHRYFLTPFFFLIYFGLIRDLSGEKIFMVLKYLIIVNGVVLSAEALLLNSGLMSVEASPAYNTTGDYTAVVGYYQRPFGLIGNFSANGSMAIYLFFLYYYFAHLAKERIKPLYIILTVLAVLVSASGQSFLTIILIGVIYFLRKPRLANISISLLIITTFVIIAHTNIIYKISYQNILDNLMYFDWKILPFVINFMNSKTFFFGNPTLNWPIDISPVYVIGNYGFIYFCIYWGIIAWAFYSYKNIFMTLAFISIFFGSLHYPTVFYFPVQVMTVLVTLFSAQQKLKNNFAITREEFKLS